MFLLFHDEKELYFNYLMPMEDHFSLTKSHILLDQKIFKDYFI